jgi:hypothetical protein
MKGIQRRFLLATLFGSLGSILISKRGYVAQMTSKNQEPDYDPNTSHVDLAVHTDFEKALQEGYNFQYNMPYEGLQTVEFSVHPIGEIILTSGKLMACDPLLPPELGYIFTKTLVPDNYPVLLSLAGFKPRGERRIACAMLQITQQKPVRWELAILDPHRSKEYQGYGVDSGTGGFLDLDAALALEKLAEPDPTAYSAAKQESSEAAWQLDSEALDRFEREFCDRLIAEMQKNKKAAANDFYPYDRKGNWANLHIDNIKANVIAFSSGWGDGGYASYWGYDSANNIACIVTDFVLFYENKDITKRLV